MLVARYELGALASAVDDAVDALVAADAVARLWARDASLFGDDPTEIANRMGWLETHLDSAAQWGAITRAAGEIAEMADHVLVMGMGGSSLFPEVLGATFGSADGFPELHVVDTTHPDALVRVAEQCPPDRTFFLASSKSGSTIETRSHLEWSWSRSGDPSRFGVVTDPGSALGALARERGFAHVWENDPDIGGRYSALSLFGMVPAALIGVDGELLLEAADEAAELLGPLGDDAALHLGLRLGAVLGAAAASGRTLLTLRLDPRLAGFAAWLEQLLAESLGKHGKGILPIYGEPDDVVVATPGRRLVVEIGDVEPLDVDAPRVAIALEEPTDIGAQVLWWEFATAIAGRVLGVNPFDQPNVESAKVAARAVLDDGAPDEPETTSIDDALALRRDGDTIIIDAFVDPGGRAAERLAVAREELAHELSAPVSLGFGPRFLHSTGQMHKGGPDDAVHLQVLEQPLVDLQIPDQPFTFGTLLRAQAAGDLTALREAGKRAVRVDVEELSGRTPSAGS